MRLATMTKPAPAWGEMEEQSGMVIDPCRRCCCTCFYVKAEIPLPPKNLYTLLQRPPIMYLKKRHPISNFRSLRKAMSRHRIDGSFSNVCTITSKMVSQVPKVRPPQKYADHAMPRKNPSK